MAEVASAFVSLAPSARGFGRQLDRQVSGQVDGVGKKVGLGFGKAMFGALGAAGAAVGIGSFLSDSIGEAREAQKVGALTNNVIKSTGGVAKVTAGHVGDLATAISNKAGIDDEAIQSGENLLLTFKNVRNELGKGNKIFDRATQAAVDLSAAGFGDLSGTSKQLGKALNDPVKGISALSRSGVTFTDQQKNQIKTLVKSGKTLQAQKIILKEVESQVGGAAAAQATAGDKLKVSFGNLKESVGTALLPVFDRLARFLTDKVIPALYELGPVVGQVKEFLAPAIEALRGFGSGGGEAGSKLTQFKTTVLSVFQSVKAIFISAVSIITSLWRIFGDTIKSSAGRAFTSILNIVRGTFLILDGLFKVVAALLKGDWSGAWDGIKQIARGALVLLKGILQGGLNTVKTIFSLAGDAIVALLGKAWDSVITEAKALPGQILGALGDLSTFLLQAGKDLIAGLASGIVSGIKDSLGGAMDSVGGFIKDHLPGSPVKRGPLKSWNNGAAGKRLVELLASGISETGPIDSAMSRLTARIAAPALAFDGGTGTGGGGMAGRRLRLVVGEREFDGYVDDRADSRVGAQRGIDGMTERAFG